MQIKKSEAIGLAVLSLGVLISVYYGWRLFWFLTDDAYISYRYVSNSILGHGYVWNPPPFKPVEGYTSFLWVVLLDIIWRLTGIHPPDIANHASLIFSYLSLLLGGLMVLKMRLNDSLRRHRVLLLGLVFVGIISNRTFLAWTSSGLERAMFNFFLTLWIFCCLFTSISTNKWSIGVALAASLIYLTRPDGLLFVFVTSWLIAIYLTLRWDQNVLEKKDFVGFLPLLVVPFHLIWRYNIYGEWLPNTFYAKWSLDLGRRGLGLNYLLSFVIEYSLWIWLGVLLVLIILRRKDWAGQLARFLRTKSVPQHKFNLVVQVVVLLTVLVHFLYYTLLVGGDHFEYRVYSHLILLIFLSFLYILNNLKASLKVTLAMLLIFISASLPIPWTHWAESQKLTTREETFNLQISVADTIHKKYPYLPDFIFRYLEFYDHSQFDLTRHAVCIRYQEHKVFLLTRMVFYPARFKENAKRGNEYPIMAAPSVGLVSWAFPNISIIDTLGLNDYVIARNPFLRPGLNMAHQRKPPAGYLECFLSNFKLYQIYYVPEDRIIECENRYQSKIREAK